MISTKFTLNGRIACGGKIVTSSHFSIRTRFLFFDFTFALVVALAEFGFQSSHKVADGVENTGYRGGKVSRANQMDTNDLPASISTFPCTRA